MVKVLAMETEGLELRYPEPTKKAGGLGSPSSALSLQRRRWDPQSQQPSLVHSSEFNGETLLQWTRWRKTSNTKPQASASM